MIITFHEFAAILICNFTKRNVKSLFLATSYFSMAGKSSARPLIISYI